MARILDKFPLKPSRGSYPWHEWLDGRIWEIRQGEDFASKPETMRAAIRVAAYRRKVGGVRISVDGPVIVFQAKIKPAAGTEPKST